VIILWELKGKDGRRYSLFSWRTRMALRHKGLAFESRPVCMSDKAAIAFSGGKTVPVIDDGGTMVRDSWKIAEHLERAYPGASTLFGGDIGRGVTHAFNVWADRAVLPILFPLMAPDIHERVDSADEDYFRGMAQGAAKKTLEELRAGRDESLKRLGRALEPMQALLKRQAFGCGAQPAYADCILFSFFQWARVMSPKELLGPEDPLCAWRERMIELHDGFARNDTLA